MHLNTSQTREQGPMHWLLAFHQLCTACLNMCVEESAGDGSGLRSSVGFAIEFIFDSMQRSCDDMYGWTQEVARDQVLAGNLRRIIEYNHGSRVCKPVLFSFTHEPQLFFRNYNESEQEETLRQANERQHMYKVNAVLSILLGGAVLLIIALGLWVILIYRRRRSYSLFKAATEPETYDASGCDHPDRKTEIELSDDDDENYRKSKKT